MARKRCFEVTNIKFTFYSSMDEVGKTLLVSETIEKYLKKYASNTSYEIVHHLNDVISPDVEINVEFSKSISLSTAEKFLPHIVGEKSILMTYMKSSKELRVSIMG